MNQRQIRKSTTPRDAIRAKIGIRCAGDTAKLANRLAHLSDISRVVLTTGSFDVVIDVVCADDETLLDLVNNELRVLPGVLSTETMVYLKVYPHYGYGACPVPDRTDVVVTQDAISSLAP